MSPEPTLAQLRAKWQAAQRGWSRDAGPLERTVKAGEDLYFAAVFLIEALEEAA